MEISYNKSQFDVNVDKKNNEIQFYDTNVNENNTEKKIIDVTSKMDINDSFLENENDVYENKENITSMNIGFDDSFIDDMSLNIINDNMGDNHILDDIESVEKFILNYNKSPEDSNDNYNDNNCNNGSRFNNSIQNSMKYDATFDIDYDNDDLIILNSIHHPSIEMGTKNSIKNIINVEKIEQNSEKNRIISVENGKYPRTQSAGVYRKEDVVNADPKRGNRHSSAGLHRKGSLGLGGTGTGTGVNRDPSLGGIGVNKRNPQKNGDEIQYNSNSLYNSPYQYNQLHNYAQHFNNTNNENLMKPKNNNEKITMNFDEFESVRIKPPIGNMGTLRPKENFSSNDNQKIPPRPLSAYPDLRPQSAYPDLRPQSGYPNFRPQSASGKGTKFEFLRNIPSKGEFNTDMNISKLRKSTTLPVSLNASNYQKKNNLN